MAKSDKQHKSIDIEIFLPLPQEAVKDLLQVTNSHKLSDSQRKELFSAKGLRALQELEQSIPASIFGVRELGALEASVKYLHDSRRLRFIAIARLLRRSSKTIWAAYSHARAKHPDELDDSGRYPSIPLSVISDRALGLQENIVKYLKEGCGLRYHQIALLLCRDDRTVWTAYRRAGEKIANESARENARENQSQKRAAS